MTRRARMPAASATGQNKLQAISSTWTLREPSDVAGWTGASHGRSPLASFFCSGSSSTNDCTLSSLFVVVVPTHHNNKNPMTALPPALDFPAMELAILAKWKEEETFQTQDKLSLDRGDQVRWQLTIPVHHSLKSYQLIIHTILTSYSHHTNRNSPSTMALPSPQASRITDTFSPAPSRIPSLATPPSQATTSPVGPAGTATDCPSSIKSIRT